MNNNGDQDDRDESFVIFFREFWKDFLIGEINKPELDLMLYLRGTANKFAKNYVTVSEVNEKLFRGRYKDNTVYKNLRSLKSKKYIYFDNRSGKKKPFEITHGNWVMGRDKIINVAETDDRFRPALRKIKAFKSEGGQRSAYSNQRSSDENKQENKDSFSEILNRTSELARTKTIKEQERKRDDNRMVVVDEKSLPISVKEFSPNSQEEQHCLDIAEELGEENMNFLLSIKSKHGFNVIEKAEQIFKEADKEKIKNKRKYFNGIVQNLIEGKKVDTTKNQPQ